MKIVFRSKENELVWKKIEKKRKATVLKINRRYESAASRLGHPLLKVRIKRGNYGTPDRIVEVWNMETGQLTDTYYNLNRLEETTRGLNKRIRRKSDSFGGSTASRL